MGIWNWRSAAFDRDVWRELLMESKIQMKCPVKEDDLDNDDDDDDWLNS